MPFFAKHKQSHGFSLIEILISISIMGILTAIVFVGLRNEQQRSSTKDAVDRLQVELSGLQNKAQSAIALRTKYCTRTGSYPGQGNACTSDTNCLVSGVQGRCVEGPPQAYGLSIAKNATTYNIFGDMPFGTTAVDGKRVIGAGSNDVSIKTSIPFGTNIIAIYIRVNNQEADRVDITFGGSEGKMLIYKEGGFGGCTVANRNCYDARIVLKNTTTGICYRVIADTRSGLITKRQYSPSCN